MDGLLSNKTTVVVGAACATFALALHLYLREAYSYWSKRGVPGPKPVPLLGHWYHILLRDRKAMFVRWTQQYGKCFGIYFGLKPYLLVADPEVAREIAIKEFDTFPDHYPEKFLTNAAQNNLFFMQSPHWKKARALMTPTFTSGKIKKMFSLLDVCADDLVLNVRERLGPHGGALVDVRKMYDLYAMDGITSCCYSLRLNRLSAAGKDNGSKTASRDDLVRAASGGFAFNLTRLLLVSCVPDRLLKLVGFTVVAESELAPIIERSIQILKKRKSAPNKFDDYLQLLVDARLDARLELDENDSHENHHAGVTSESLINDQKRLVSEVTNEERINGDRNGVAPESDQLTEMEVISGTAFFLQVGLETTSNLLTSSTYTLAFHPEAQQRLYEEVSKMARWDDKRAAHSFEYDDLTSCKYLDAFISETLRLFSPVTYIDRRAEREFHLQKYNVHIPKDGTVLISLSALHLNPEYWPEPLKFDPQRFMSGNKEKIVPGTYCPFGLGPRHCIGMRFSLTESKLGLAKLVMNYKVEPAPETTFPPPFENLWPWFLLKMADPLVKMVPREATV